MRRSNNLNWRFHVAVISQARDVLRPTEPARQSTIPHSFYSNEARIAIQECLDSIAALKVILADQGFELDTKAPKPRRA